MADSTVPCPSCGKQYRIREGSNAGTFICTACGGEVSYGAPAQARPAQARPAGGGGGGGKARRPRAAAGAPKNLKRTRAASERPARRQREGAPPPKTNTGLYIGIGALVVVVMAAVVVVVMNTDDPPRRGPNVANQNPGDGTGGTPEANADGNTGGGPTPASTDPIVPDNRPESLREDPEPEPAREPKREQIDTRKRAVDNKETDPYKMQKMQLRAKSYKFFIDHLKHLDETPQDQRDEIDKLCATLVDKFAGSDGPSAQDRLAEIGKAAVPRILLAFSKVGDLGDQDGVMNACFVDATLHKICGNVANTDPMKFFHSPTKSLILKNAKYWCAWWFFTGHTLDTFVADEGGDDEEEEE